MLPILSVKGKDIFNAVIYFEKNKDLTIAQCAELFGIHRQTLANKHLNSTVSLDRKYERYLDYCRLR